MNGSDLNKVKQNIIEKFKGIIKDNLLAIVLTGSASQNAYKTGWSDLDFLIVVERLDFDVKRVIAGIVTELENDSGIHHGLNVIDENEFFNPIIPEVLLDGKTLQALIDLKKYPDRLIYSKRLIDLNNAYSPNSEVIKSYSISNIGMFLRRNRQTLTRAAEHSTEDLKELLKKEMRASLIITKLAVQYFTAIPQEGCQDVLKQAKLLFPDFNLGLLEENFQIINKWQEINDKKELLDVFRRTDDYIEHFTHYVFEKSKK